MDLIDDPRSPNFSAIFEIPGLRNSDISVQIQEGHLIVCGERRPPYLQTILSQPSPPDSEAVSKDASEHMEVDSPASQAVRVPVQELRFGTFQRNIPIPKGIKEKDVSASLADGMLTVTWPRLSPAAVSSSLSPPARTIGSASPPTSAVTAGTALQ
ncbi:hypothetical protein NLJ89_g8233 [Agrocybe chaxingu]|uniref:SHSP domain-containing protein n=1 Tax=Agrocybe chaxingu TaxID=84603 RepID=A0A9W8JUU1_9AGAR|nr:hypothetical protein NLJ89_g8233 [Agrocybe chaxingu]